MPPEPPGTAQEGMSDRLTLGRLLQERLLRPAAAACGPRDADREITWCLPWDQVMAGREPLAGILVYARGDQADPAGVRLLGKRAAAALVVAGGECPPAGATIPVLTVGETVTFRDVSRLVAELSLARETHVLRYGIDVHHSLVETLYLGGGLSGLCYQMSRLAAGPATILDPQYRVLAFEQARTGRLNADEAATLVQTAVTPPGDGDRKRSAQVVTVVAEETRMTCVASPILVAGRHDGWVAVIETEYPPHPHDLAQHRVVVEQSATIVGTEMLRMRSIEQAEERTRGDFVHALLHGRFTTARELEARASHYDFPVAASYGVIVADRLSRSTEPESVSALFQYAKAAARLMPRDGVATLATVVGDIVVVIRQVDGGPRPAAPDAAGQLLAEYAAALERDLSRRSGHPVSVAWGRAVPGADRIIESYREARLALELHARLGLRHACGFADLRLFATLAELAENDKAQAFARDMLAPLRTQRAGAANLEQSVLTYIESGGNLNAAARELHIHRNTMLYKIERASQVLDLDLRQAEHRFEVWLAHKLEMLFETDRAVNREVMPGLPGFGPAKLTARPAASRTAPPANSGKSAPRGYMIATHAAPNADPANRIILNNPRAVPVRPAGDRVIPAAEGVCTSATPMPAATSRPARVSKLRPPRSVNRLSSRTATPRSTRPTRSTRRGLVRSLREPTNGALSAIVAGSAKSSVPATAVLRPSSPVR